MKNDGRDIAQELKAWLNSEEGHKCLTEPVSNPYLRNRLERAFIAGWDAAKLHYTEEVEKT